MKFFDVELADALLRKAGNSKAHLCDALTDITDIGERITRADFYLRIRALDTLEVAPTEAQLTELFEGLADHAKSSDLDIGKLKVAPSEAVHVGPHAHTCMAMPSRAMHVSCVCMHTCAHACAHARLYMDRW